MRGVSFSIPDQKQSNLWIIEDSKDGQVFTIDQDTKQCYKSQLPIQPMNCIPGIIDLTSLFNRMILFVG